MNPASQQLRFLSALETHLDWFAARGQQVRLWWRDDDACTKTDKLDRLLGLSQRYRMPLALAVIPSRLDKSLVQSLKGNKHVRVFQHGWDHKSYQRSLKGSKAAEFGSRRDLHDALLCLSHGRALLHFSFGSQFLPVLVPPWNRISPQIARTLPEVGLDGLSTFNWVNTLGADQVQCHVDIIKWKKSQAFIGWHAAQKRFDLQLSRRRTNPLEPLGLLTHHLSHDDICFDFIQAFLSLTNRHKGACWPSFQELFPKVGPVT
ncbi:polysaccharide deacetylase family protein [Flexibacterium corallicola]|uniref:polysaccharide deacetylase family protein n=1 Tax=Flexibacterium corallicola TaxID=3037259 RepID=UPI00286F490D|nr:polysaccharide deacetylase family protein [Pseudovibrio sp. M1P-2-3]